MRLESFLRTQTELLAAIEARMTDTSNTLATEAQYYAGISEAVSMWGRRVVTPRLYSLPNGFSTGTYEYDLPSYIRKPFVLQIKSPLYTPYGIPAESDDNTTWETITGYSVEPSGTGGFKLRLHSTPYSDAGRIIWFSENGPVPVPVPTLTAAITASDVLIALTVTSAPELNQSGFFKIDSEWISYTDLTRTSATSYTATGCLRGLFGSTAASHLIAAPVPWGVMVDDQRLWIQLYDYVAAYLHALQLHKSTTEDMSRHEKLMSFYQSKADGFWRQSGYVSQRKAALILGRNAMGPPAW